MIHQLQVTAVHLAAGHHGHVTDDPSRAVPLSAARSYLRTADPVLARLIDERPDFDPRAWISQLPPMDLFGALLFQVAGQQLSVAATRRTIARVQDLFGGHLPAPAELLSVDLTSSVRPGFRGGRSARSGTSPQRMSDGRLEPGRAEQPAGRGTDGRAHRHSGIGPWTVQGALIVALQREDVVLPGDLALRKAVRAAYQLDHLPTQQEVLAIAEKWRPYRSLATSYLFSAAFEPAG